MYWHPDSQLSFKSKEELTVVGKIIDDVVIPITKDDVDTCKKWGFAFSLPEVDEKENKEEKESDEKKEEENEVLEVVEEPPKKEKKKDSKSKKKEKKDCKEQPKDKKKKEVKKEQTKETTIEEELNTVVKSLGLGDSDEEADEEDNN